MSKKLNIVASLYQSLRPKKKPAKEEAPSDSQADQTAKSVRDALGGESTRPDPLKKKK